MNEKILHITNGLNEQYPLPDIPADNAWADMQRLLDDDDDNTIVPPPIPPVSGNNGYRKYGLLLLLIAGMAIYYVSNKNKIQQVATAKHTVNSVEQKVGKQTNDSKETSRRNDATRENISSTPAESLIRQQYENKHDSLENKIILPVAVSKNDQIIETGKGPGYKKNNAASSEVKENILIKNKKYTTGSNAQVIISGGDVGENDANMAKAEMSRKKRGVNITQKLHRIAMVVNVSERKSKYPKSSNNDDQQTSKDSMSVVVEKIPESNTANKSEEPSVHIDSFVPVSSPSTTKNGIKDQQAVVSKPGKLKTDTTSKINNEKGKKITWAAGFGLNQSFAIGSQQYSGYNANGHRNIMADYIPVPFILGRLNKKLYLQLETHFNSPQYTRPLLIKKEIRVDSNGNKENSTYINKLYYFNIPLSIHYCVNNNFNIGTGLQFSHLTNAVGLFEVKQPGVTGTDRKTAYTSLKNDPLYKEIKTTEWRILFDANYQWKYLAFGIRYNQALSNFINIPISSTQIAQGKNNSVQFFVWYTLWKNNFF